MTERTYLVLDAETHGDLEKSEGGLIFRPEGCWPRSVQGLISNESGSKQRLYWWDTAQEASRVLSEVIGAVDLVVGWGITGFDIPLVNALLQYHGYEANWPQVADLMMIVASQERQYGDTPLRWKLDDVLWATLGLRKTGSNKDAPTMDLWELVGYGMNDVALEDAAFRFSLRYGYLISPKGYQRAIDIPGWIEPSHPMRYETSAEKKVAPISSDAQMRKLGEILHQPWPSSPVDQRIWLKRNQDTFARLLLQSYQGRPNKYQASELIDTLLHSIGEK